MRLEYQIPWKVQVVSWLQEGTEIAVDIGRDVNSVRGVNFITLPRFARTSHPCTQLTDTVTILIVHISLERVQIFMLARMFPNPSYTTSCLSSQEMAKLLTDITNSFPGLTASLHDKRISRQSLKPTNLKSKYHCVSLEQGVQSTIVHLHIRRLLLVKRALSCEEKHVQMDAAVKIETYIPLDFSAFDSWQCDMGHPSPAVEGVKRKETEPCKFFPNCTNPECPYKQYFLPSLCFFSADS